MQANHAEQGEAGVGRLRGGEPGAPAKDVQSEVGVHLHAGRVSVQGGPEARQAGAEDPGHTRARLLGRVPAAPGLCQHHRARHQKGLQVSKLTIQRHRQSQVRPCNSYLSSLLCRSSFDTKSVALVLQLYLLPSGDIFKPWFDNGLSFHRKVLL